jgi:hypothetical protein
VALAAGPSIAMPSWNPLRSTGTDLPINLTVLVKVLAMVVLLTNHVRILPDPWLPFIPGLDALPAIPFQRTLQTIFLISAVAIVFNRRLRLFSLILGATMLLAVVSSKAYYGNNKTFCGLMFFLAGLYKPGGPPFLRWQLAITYFGAGLNKALDADWHSGVFFENWAVNRLHQPMYLALDGMLPAMWLARLMCWSTIVTELGTVPCILIPALNEWAVIANIIFQSGLLLFTGTTFTLFFYSMSAASLAFVTWPEGCVEVTYNPAHKWQARARRFFASWDFDDRFHWTAANDGLTFRAMRRVVLLNPVTYFVIAGSIAVLGDVPGPSATIRRIIVGTCLLLLMPPLAWLVDRFSVSPAKLQAWTPVR